jgi:hypothetical protein
LTYYVAKQCVRHLQSSGALHPVIWALASAVVLQFVSHASQLVHLLSYRGDGVGLWMVDAFAEILFMASQMVHATLFIAIAKGYTLVPAKDCQLEFTRLSFAASLAAHAALVCFGKLQEGTSSHRHHDNDGPEGLAIILIRCLLFGCFVSALRDTETRSGYCVQELLRRIRCAGSLYFLSYPIVFLAAQIFAAYLRHPIMEVGLFIVQASADVWLAKLFLDRSPYWKASCLGASLLPGGTCFGGSTIFGIQKGE